MPFTRTIPPLLSALVCLAGCGPSPALDTASEPGSTDAPATTLPDTSTGPAEPTTAALPDSTTDGESTAAAACGDGSVDAGEDCDDGNGVDGDGCNVDCTLSAALLWEHRSGIGGYDVFLDLALTAGGGIVAGGSRLQPGAANDERWLVRFDLDGGVVWERVLDGGPELEQILAVGSHGPAIYAAGTWAHGDDLLDLWLGRFDLDGELVWEQEVSSGLGNDYATAIATTAEGDLVVTGLVKQQEKFVGIWTRRYAPDGAEQWTQHAPAYGQAQYYVGPDVVASPDRIVVAHFSEDFGDAPRELLLAYAPDTGAPIWTQAPNWDSLFLAVAAAPGGPLYAAGQGLSPAGFVVRGLTGDGELAWSTFECVGDAARALAVDSRGDLVAIGFGAGEVGANIRLCKLTPDGKLRWGKDLDGGEGDDYGHAVRILPDDRIVVAGEMHTGGSADAWLALFTP